MSGLVISGGRVVDPASGMDAIGDVAVLDGKIAAALMRKHLDAAVKLAIHAVVPVSSLIGRTAS